ncbi:unnamed protein product, partial [Rotaria sp. Silwood2]
PISRFKTYQHSTELQPDVANLWWTVDETEAEIMFELHIKTTGWIALGISPAGGMKGADIGVGWIDNRGQIHFQDQYAFGFTKPVTDNTTTDWFPLQGREENGWTAIQFKRLLDTCDSMDVPIKSGSNIVIFAYGLIDPDMFETYGDISYHENRRNSRMIPLRTYANPPSDDKFVEFDYVEFRLDNYRVPSTDTTYHCKIFKAPSHFLTKRHAIAVRIQEININYEYLKQLLLSIKRTAELAEQWQEFYNNATRLVVFGRAEHLDSDILENLPKFENLKPVECRKEPIVNSATSNTIDFSLAFISYLLQKILSYNK